MGVCDFIEQKAIIPEVAASMIGIFLGMTVLGFMDKGGFYGLFPYLFVALLGLLIGRLVLFIMSLTGESKEEVNTGGKVLSWVGTILFALFVGYDTAELKKEARKKITKPDYIDSSLGLFLDIVNLFVNIVGTQE